MAKRIYGFVCDEALQKWHDSNGFDPALIVANLNQGAGVATQNVIEYFNKIAVVKDTRRSRFTNLTGSSEPLYGKLAFIIDQEPPNDEGSTVTAEGSGAIQADVLDIDDITPSMKWNNVFNIIEDCMYYRGSGTATVIDMLNAKFQTATEYGGYIPRSINMSSSATSVTYIPGVEARVANDTILNSESVKIPLWFEFGFNFEIEGYEDVIIKLWVGEQSFLEQYPLTTITGIAFPCEASKLATPSTLVGSGSDTTNIVLDAILENSELINTVYKNNFKSFNNENQAIYTESSGVAIFNTPYFPDTLNKTVKFGVIYKGSTPNNELCRKAIRNKLLETNISENVWRNALPYLFTNAVFFIVPMWTNVFQRTNDTTKYESGITKWNSFFNYVKSLFPTYPESTLLQKLELLLNDATNLVMAVVPSLSNEGNRTMKLMQPTYMPVDATTPNFLLQDEETQRLNQDISRAFACADIGEVDTTQDIYTGFSLVEHNVGTEDNPVNLKFIYFQRGAADYYMLSKVQDAATVNIGE